MGKLVAVFTAATLIVVGLAAPSSAAIKDGSTCPKVGKTQVQSAVSFTCTKVGVRLIWKKSKKSASSTKLGLLPNAPREGDSCSGQTMPIGRNLPGRLVYLSCGPDGHLHPQNGAPAIDQVTGKPIRGELGSTISTTDYVAPPSLVSKPASVLSSLSTDVSPCKIADAGRNGEIAGNTQRHFVSGFGPYPERAVLSDHPVIQFVPVDFADVRAKHSPASDYEIVTKFLKSFWETMGSKPLNVEIRMPDQYIHLPKNVLQYDLASDFFKTGKPPTGAFNYAQVAISAADADIDFSDVDIIAVVPTGEVTDKQVSSFTAQAAEPGQFFSTSEKPIANVLIASALGTGAAYELLNWAHETGHMFGLTDARNVPSVGSQDSSPLGVFDLMNSMIAPEILAWQRFILGTIYDSQVACAGTGTTVAWLTPLEQRDQGVKLAVVPLSKYTALAIESRRSYGYDSTLGSAAEGLIVYKIDTTVPYRLSPFKIITPNGASDLEWKRDAALKQGETIVVEGVSITNIESGAFGDVVSILVK